MATSEGRFEDGTIGLWADDALAVLRAASSGPQILVGSSMGAWIALLVARSLAEGGEAGRIAGSGADRAGGGLHRSPDVGAVQPRGQAGDRDHGPLAPSRRPTAPQPYPITLELIEEGRRHLLLGGVVRAYGPVHILQGMQDADVPWQHAMLLVEHLAADPASITLIKDGDHRLSRDEDIARLIAAVENVV